MCIYLEMNICRICLISKFNTCSIFDSDKGVSYASMIARISNIKCDVNEVICCNCCIKLRELYKFKELIERSDIELNKNKKIYKFNSINDIKNELFTDLNQNQLGNLDCEYQMFIHNGLDCSYYKNTFIKKIKKHPLPHERLESIKSDVNEDNDHFEYESHKRNKFHGKKLKMKSKTKEKMKKTCIQPVFLKDVRLIKTSVTNVCKIKNLKSFGKREGICPYCGRRKKHMQKHLLLHTAERKFRCNECSRTFYTKKDLEYHIKSHLIQPTYNCNNCIALFKSKGSLLRHMVIHTDIKEYICEMCNKAFKWKSGLLRHMLIHNFSKEFKCEVCNMSFSTKHTYQHHTRVHTGERPYKCELCSQPYSYKRDFNRHCFKKHGVIVDRRPIYLMNEQVLQREKNLIKDLVLRTQGIPTENEPLDSFQGPQRAKAFAKALTLIQNCSIPIDAHVTF